MASVEEQYAIHTIVQSVDEAKRLVVLLRETIDRRFRPDEVVEAALTNVDMELALLRHKLKRLTGE